MSLDKSLGLKWSRTSARSRWIKTPSNVAERCRGGLLQFGNAGLSHRGVCGMIFGPIPTTFSHWFKKRRSLVFGISATGSSQGGTIVQIVSLQPVCRSYRVRKINPHQRTLSTGLCQVQLNNTNHCSDCICDARNCKPGNNLTSLLR